MSPAATPEQSYSRVMARLSGWANDPAGGKRRGWTGVAEDAGLLLERRDRGAYSEWLVSTREGDTIGFLHEFADHVYAFTFTGWETTGWLRRLWHRIRGCRS